MKKMIHLLLLTLLLLGAMSTSSLADGGSPPPMCSPAIVLEITYRRCPVGTSDCPCGLTGLRVPAGAAQRFTH